MADDVKALADRLNGRPHEQDCALRFKAIAHRGCDCPRRDDFRAAAILDHLAAALPVLLAEHRPMWVNPERGAGFTDEAQEGFDPVGCVSCYPGDGSWPCSTRLEFDGLADLIDDS